VTDHTPPTGTELAWQKMAHSPLNGIAKALDIAEEGLSATQTLAEKISLSNLVVNR